MEKDRGTKIIAICAICIAVIGMTIGFAAFSTTLRIEGTGTVKASNWSVIFADLQPAVTTGTASEGSGGTPTIQPGSTTISNYKAELSTPGDSISYTFKIRNEGTYDASIASISMAGLGGTPFEVTSATDNETDETNVKGKLSYTLVDTGTGNQLAVGDTIEAGNFITAKLTLTYQNFADHTLLPQNPVTIDNLGVTIVYEQA